MCYFLKKFRTSIRANKIATNLALWLCLIILQAVQYGFILYDGKNSSELIFSDFFVDWKTAIAILFVCFALFFAMTKINKNNAPDQSISQTLIESEIASVAMNLGGAMLLVSSNILLIKNDYQMGFIYVSGGFAIYFLSWLLLPD